MSKLSWTGSWLPVLHRLPDAGPREVALTIDDGPSDATPDLLRAFARVNARATFFLSGCRVVERPALVEAILAGGHDVYTHGYAHDHLDEGEPADIVRALSAGEALLAALRPTPSPYLVRLPYAAGRRQAWVHRAIRSWSPNAQIVHWNRSLEDHTIAPRCRDGGDVTVLCAETVSRAMASPDLGGSIFLMHDQPFDIGSPHLAAVTTTLAEMLTERLAAAGFAIVPARPQAKQALASRFVLEK